MAREYVTVQPNGLAMRVAVERLTWTETPDTWGRTATLKEGTIPLVVVSIDRRESLPRVIVSVSPIVSLALADVVIAFDAAHNARKTGVQRERLYGEIRRTIKARLVLSRRARLVIERGDEVSVELYPRVKKSAGGYVWVEQWRRVKV